MGLTPGQQEEYRRLQTDPVYFYQRFFSTPEEPYPFSYQKEIMADLASGRYKELCILKGRQIGMSWTVGALGAWFCTMNDEKHVLIAAFNLDQAQIPLNYAKIFMSRTKRKGWHEMFIEGQSARNLRWHNGSKMSAFGCVLPKALIIGNTNTRCRADEMIRGDNILSINGEFDEITKIFIREYDGDLYKINPIHILPFEVTEEHPIYVVTRKKTKERKRTNRGRVWEPDKFLWLTPSELKVKEHFVVFPKFKPKEKLYVFKFKIDKTRKYMVADSIKNDIILDEEFARFLGYYVAEGWVYDNSIFLAFNKEERDYIEDVSAIVSKLGFKIYKRTRDNVTELRFTSHHLSKLLKKDFKTGARKKQIPNYLMASPLDVVKQFLIGYYRGDGCFIKLENKWFVRFSTISEKLAIQIQLLMSRFNIPISIIKNIRPEKIWDNRVFPEQTEYVGHTKNRIIEEFFDLPRTTGAASRRWWMEDENNFYFPIRKITTRKYKGKVHNFETKNHTYLVSNIVVHNCTVPDAYNIRGQKADLLIIDEAAFIYDRMFPSITPTVANTGGPTLLLSTAGSIGSYFYRRWADGNRATEWRRKLEKGYDLEIAKDEIPPVKSYIIPSVECPRLTKEKLEAERRGLGEMKYKREYECMWAGTADQVFIKIPTFTLRKRPTRSIKPCYGGIDCGKVNDPTVLMVIEQFNSVASILTEGGIREDVDVPFRVVYGKTWERKTQAEIATDIMANIHPRFPSRLYSIDATGGFGDDLLNRMTNYELPCRGLKVKIKNKNEMILGSPAVMGLSDAFAEELLWINNDINDIIATELLFELNAYIGKLRASGLYTFDSVIDRDHMVDALTHAWSAFQAGSFEPYFTIRKRR